MTLREQGEGSYATAVPIIIEYIVFCVRVRRPSGPRDTCGQDTGGLATRTGARDTNGHGTGGVMTWCLCLGCLVVLARDDDLMSLPGARW